MNKSCEQISNTHGAHGIMDPRRVLNVATKLLGRLIRSRWGKCVNAECDPKTIFAG